MRQGIPLLRFNNIPDARTVVTMAKSARKNMIDRSKEPSITAGMNSRYVSCNGSRTTRSKLHSWRDNPAVSQANIHSTICQIGYSKAIF
jgi:hypothetical protein